MVSHNYLDDQDDEFYQRRNSARARGYSFEHDQDLSSTSAYPTTRSQRFPPLGSRGHSQERASKERPRNRIPVACGRCRKRKIRCSGDNDGGPCENCKNARHEQCQFLRVSSTPTAMKSDLPAIDYDAGVRLNYQSVPYATLPYRPSESHLPSENFHYRNGSIPVCSYSKPIYQHYGEHIHEEPLDYGLAGELNPYVNLGLSPNYVTSNIRGWTSTPGSPPIVHIMSKNPMILEQQGSIYHPAPSLPLESSYRPFNFAPEKMEHQNSMRPSSPLPFPTVADRVLPMPSANRSAAIVSFLHSADGLPYGSSMQYGNGSSLSRKRTFDDANSTGLDNSDTHHDAISNTYHGSITDSAAESLGAPQMGYHTQSLGYEQAPSEGEYTTSDRSRYDQALTDSAYSSATVSSRSPHSSQDASTPAPTNQDTAVSSVSGGREYLPHRNAYMPADWQQPQGSYPLPPVVPVESLRPLVPMESLPPEQHSSPITHHRFQILNSAA